MHMSYIWMPVKNPNALPGVPTGRVAPAGACMLQAQPRMSETGEFLGCQASVMYRDQVVEACMIEPVRVDGSAADIAGATMLQAQSWCQFTVMVMAYGLLAPAGESDYSALDRWLAAVRQNDRPKQVGEILQQAATQQQQTTTPAE